MKVRWKEHEIMGVTMLIVWQMVLLFVNMNGHSQEAMGMDFITPFKANGIPFGYWKNVLLPQIGSLLLMYVAYLLINLLILPSIKQISGKDIEQLYSPQIIKALAAVLFVSYLVAIGINILSFYARPHFFNYGGYQFLSLAGYNDKPLSNLFFGFGRTLAAVLLITALSGLRDLIIWWIERPDARREYRVMITNNATPLFIIYFLLLVFLNPLHDDFLRYFVFVTPLPLLYLYLVFWLFPYKGQKTFLEKSVVIRLLMATFLCIVPSVFLFFGHPKPFIPMLYWMLLIFVAVPFFWIIYQQRKDKILQLKNIETALAKSDATLQFLKSQINPHFLFNALNTLYGTALKGDNEKTAEGIQKLGDMMRFMLHENTRDLIPMDKEIEYLTNFISLQKLRIQTSPDISIEDSIDESCAAARQIAPMLLIPFVENAFKHGISLTEKSWIRIELRCKKSIIDFEVRNSVHKNAKNLEHGKSGIGLANVRERLKHHYPGKHMLDIAETENEFSVKLTLQC